MPWHEFIYSEKKQARQLRHGLFWLAWYCYFLVCFYLFQQPLSTNTVSPFYLNPGPVLPVKTVLLLLLYALACYTVLYGLLPRILNRKRIPAFFFLLLVAGFLLVTTHILYWQVFPGIDRLFGVTAAARPVAYYWPSVNLGLLQFIKVAAVAVLIRYIKIWQQQQKKNEQLAKEKLETELQLLKAQVQPEFLVRTLNQVHRESVQASPLAPEMILRLSDLLSYMLYEVDQPRVPLEKEIEMMQHYIALGKLQYGGAAETVVTVKGDTSGKDIAPFLLLPFIENSFHWIGSSDDQAWINLDIRVTASSLSFHLVHGMPGEAAITVPGIHPGSLLSHAEKRLQWQYPGTHELKITREQDMFIVLLQINLDTPVQVTPAPGEHAQQPPLYPSLQKDLDYA